VGRSSNVFLENGSRLYLDVGSHPEYATAECDSLRDVVAQDKAGEAILRELVDYAQGQLSDEGSAATSSCSRTTPTHRATPTAATRTTASSESTT